MNESNSSPQIGVAARQATTQAKRLLGAYQQLYLRVKSIWTVRWTVPLVLAAATLLKSWWEPIEIILGVLSVSWAFAGEFVVGRAQEQYRRLAVVVQEAFDTYVFDLPWNEVLVGPQPNPETVYEAASALSAKVPDDWYTVVPGTHGANWEVLLCQRTSMAWSWKLRRFYGWFLYSLFAILFLVWLGVALYFNPPFVDVFKSILPFSGIMVVLTKEASAQIESARAAEKDEQELNKMIDSGIEPDRNHLRQIQDRLYRSRNIATPVPEWLYLGNREKRQRAADEAVRYFAAKLVSISEPKSSENQK